jgi:hypothetical protein
VESEAAVGHGTDGLQVGNPVVVMAHLENLVALILPFRVQLVHPT